MVVLFTFIAQTVLSVCFVLTDEKRMIRLEFEIAGMIYFQIIYFKDIHGFIFNFFVGGGST